MDFTVRRAEPDDIESCVQIIRDLPEFFTEEVPEWVRADIQQERCWVVADADTVQGFAVVQLRGSLVAEVLWIAVAPGRRNTGIGTALIDRVLAELAAAGIALVEAKTLDMAHGYQPYAATNGFWTHRGFAQVDTIDPMPGWQPGKPAAILVAALRPTVTAPGPHPGPPAR